jgi:hypothetical protein
MQTTLAEFTLVRDCALGKHAATLGAVLDSPILRRATATEHDGAGAHPPEPGAPPNVAGDAVVDPALTLGSRTARAVNVASDRVAELTPDPASGEARRIQSLARALDVRNPGSDPLVLIEGATADEPTTLFCQTLFVLSDRIADAGDAVTGPGRAPAKSSRCPA